jgi:hypothetical protein
MARRPTRFPLRPRQDSGASSRSTRDHQIRLVAWFAVCISVLSFLFYLKRGDVLLYGDAVAHINIARRVFDSRTPGLLQLGTVWLPLPHLLMIPFLVSDKLWITGIGGSIPSLLAYVFGVVGIFRLVRGTFLRADESRIAATVASWIAALIYAANPNLIYMQSTAMGEALYLALFIWSVFYFSEFIRGNTKALTRCGLCLAAACWTRYDGWFLAVAMAAVAIAHSFFQHAPLEQDKKSSATGSSAKTRATDSSVSASRSVLLKFIVITAAAPAIWLAYNAIVYRNPLEFANGPYSAKAIEKRTQTAGSAGHPGTDNLYLAGLYFLKSAEENVAVNQWLQRLWVALTVAAVIGLVVERRTSNGQQIVDGTKPASIPLRSFGPLLFLLVPLPFYALSVAYSGVPIFIPSWWPFTHYNVRYGLELLPAFSVGLATIVYLALKSTRQGVFAWLQGAAFFAVLLLIIGYIHVWRVGPVCYQEASLNMRGRNALEKQVADWLKLFPPNATLLMYVGDHVGALQQAGVPLKRTINEGNHRVWMQSGDPEGLWERALANPAAYADYVVAFQGDSVWQAVQDKNFRELVEIEVSGQPRAILYRLR